MNIKYANTILLFLFISFVTNTMEIHIQRIEKQKQQHFDEQEKKCEELIKNRTLDKRDWSMCHKQLAQAILLKWHESANQDVQKKG